MLTGKTPLRGDLELLADDPLQPPCFGSALSAMKNDQSGLSYVALPYTMFNVVQLPGQTAGFLGSRYERFQIDGNPNDPKFQVRSLQLPGEVAPRRLQGRESLLKTLDTGCCADPQLPAFYDQAFSVLSSTKLQGALQIGDEAPTVRDNYGRHLLGQCLLLARRLVEADVRMICVFDGRSNCQTCNWDSHAENFARHKDVLIPPLDQGLAALIGDLDQRGLLASTLVISVGEFGRTPVINRNGGRDHWPDCFSALIAGGGTPGGTVFGASDRLAAYPARDPVSPGDIAATLFSQFGIDPHATLRDPTGRLHPLAEGQALF
jgi:hypothetical protein